MRLTILIATLAITTCILPQPYSAQSTLTIEGFVLEADTDRPLEEVTVFAVSPDHTHKTKTDSAGRFAIEIAAPGRYLVTPARDGMVFARPARLQIPREPGVWVELSSERVSELQLRMVREAVITGRVLDSNGKPFPASQGKVDVLRYRYDARGKRKLEAVPVVHQGPLGTYGRMDDRGEYRLYGLQPGDYYVAGGGGGVRLFYPGTPDESSAERIHVNAGEEVRLTTITLPVQQKRTRVSFRFVGTDGKSLAESVAGSAVSLHTKTGSVLGSFPNILFGAPMPAEPDVRSFELAPGRFDQLITLTGMRTTTELFYAPADFNVGSADMEQVVQMSRGLRVTGSLTLEDAVGTHPNPSGVLCKLYTDAPHAETVGTSIDKGCIGAAFSPALYELEVAGMPPDAYVESAQAASGEDILTKGLQLNADAELKIVLRSPGSVIEGLVRNSSGDKLTDAIVALVPDAPLRSAGLLYRSVISDINGRYQLRGVAPGSYHLFAWTELEGAAYRNEEFMKEFDGKGTPLKIDKGERISQDIAAF